MADDIVGALGLDDPDRVLPRPERSRTYYTEWVDVRGATDRQPNAVQPTPSWVERARMWVPPDLSAPPRPVEFDVEGLVPRGLVGALIAAGETGKTTFKITRGVCHATERHFLGRRTRPGSFVIFSSDDPQEHLEDALKLVCQSMKLTAEEQAEVAQKVRVISLQGEAGLKTFTQTTRGGSPVSTGLESHILQALDGIDDLAGIYFDTLRHFAGASTNDEQGIVQTIAAAQTIATATGASVTFGHHVGKANYREAVTDQYAAAGSSAIADNSRFVLLLLKATWSEVADKVQRTGREQGDPLVLVPTRGSLRVKKSGPIHLYRDGYLIDRVQGAALTHEQMHDAKDRAVLQAVRDGAQSKNAISSRVGGRKQHTLDRIDDLEARGHLVNGSANGSSSHPKYTLTSSGARFLDQAS